MKDGALIVDQYLHTVYERHFGAATKNTDNFFCRTTTVFKSDHSFVVFISYFLYGLACFIVFLYPVR